MAALLVGIAVMGILMSAAMPVWRQQAQREKEAELVFRGEQWARAVMLFQRKFAGAFPPNVNVLVEQKFIRKRYKDPITKDDFQPVFQGAQSPGAVPGGVPGQTTPGTMGTPGGGPGQGGGTPKSTPAPTPGRGGGTSSASTSFGGQVGPSGGILGFTSKSKDTSIRLYNGRSRYNEWVFMNTQMSQQPGAVPGGQRPGGPGQPMPGFPPGQGPRGRGGRGSSSPGGMQPGPGVRPPGMVPPGRPPG